MTPSRPRWQVATATSRSKAAFNTPGLYIHPRLQRHEYREDRRLRVLGILTSPRERIDMPENDLLHRISGEQWTAAYSLLPDPRTVSVGTTMQREVDVPHVGRVRFTCWARSNKASRNLACRWSAKRAELIELPAPEKG